jgi:dTDP-4-dehydrorhamnose 3,5-epimerase
MAHGFVVLSDEAIFQYKCDNLYHPESEGSIAWNDPAIGIDWGIDPESVILSERDKGNRPLADLEEVFKYGEEYYA